MINVQSKDGFKAVIQDKSPMEGNYVQVWIYATYLLTALLALLICLIKFNTRKVTMDITVQRED